MLVSDHWIVGVLACQPHTRTPLRLCLEGQRIEMKAVDFEQSSNEQSLVPIVKVKLAMVMRLQELAAFLSLAQCLGVRLPADSVVAAARCACEMLPGLNARRAMLLARGLKYDVNVPGVADTIRRLAERVRSQALYVEVGVKRTGEARFLPWIL